MRERAPLCRAAGPAEDIEVVSAALFLGMCGGMNKLRGSLRSTVTQKLQMVGFSKARFMSLGSTYSI